MNIILIGMSGSGKTTIGEELRKIRKMDLIDTDEKIKLEVGKEINEIFTNYGEEYFRDYETKVLKNNINIENTVFATGGGIILREENRELLKNIGIRFLLKGRVDTLIRNLKNSQEVRPLLKDTEDLKSDIIDMIEKREWVYEESKDYEIIIDDKNVNEIVNEIMDIINLVE